MTTGQISHSAPGPVKSTYGERVVPDYLPIAAYALIGDCHTAALVSIDGSIDWYCPGRFDAAAVFCRLLDVEKGGFFRLAPAGPHTVTRRYLGATNILETTFIAGDGEVRVTDLMPVFERQPGHRGYDVGNHNQILRCVEVRHAPADVDIYFRPTFDYARAQGEVRLVHGGAVAHAASGEDASYLVLACPGVVLTINGRGAVHGRLHLEPGERRWVALTHVAGIDETIAVLDEAECERRLEETSTYWESWAGWCRYRGPYHEEVLRSALVLKLLTYEPTGAIVAAPTTSLPEEIGGVRNWDYRFTWLRDASLILYALVTVGYYREARDFFGWLHRIEQADPEGQHQIMYTIDGGRELPETDLEHLEGYRGSRPVRIGNEAARQIQHDVYGAVLGAAYLYFKTRQEDDDPATEDRPSPDMWALLCDLVEEAARYWQEPDQSIWEVRGGPQHFLYSKLMCWTALDRGLRMADTYGLEAPRQRWAETREAIRRAILKDGYDENQDAFVQAFGSQALDASALTIPLVGFLPPTDPRVRSTVARIQSDLTHDGLVYRYHTKAVRPGATDDGLPGGEATFALCSFWLVSALALGGQVDEAQDLFERTIGYANDVGLMAEEIDPRDDLLLGNFPQGFTHLGLIQAAVNLAKATKHGAEVEVETEGERAPRARQAANEGYPGGRRGESRPRSLGA